VLSALPRADPPAGPPAGAAPAASPEIPQETVDRMQSVTRELAFAAGSWTSERAEEIRGFFDALAPEWHVRNQAERLRPLEDAIARGGVPAGGICVEIGSGTGFQTPTAAKTFDFVVSVDLSAEMLARSPRLDRAGLVQADANLLPFRPRSAHAVLCVNAFLFPAEYVRVLRDGGMVIFVSTRGDRTPIYLPPADIVRALELASGPSTERTWSAVTSEASSGTWTVVTASR
jgi:SAM-dependent methyltransferase